MRRDLVVHSVLLAALGWIPLAGGDPEECIVFTHRGADGRGIWAMRPDGSQARLVIAPASSAMGEACPSLSPDGGTLVFSTYRYGGWKLATVPTSFDAEEIERFGSGGGYWTNAAFSPDGASVVYERDTRRGPRLYVSRADGDDAVCVVERRGQNREPSFTPDGTSIVFSGSGDDGNRILLQRIEGGSDVVDLSHGAPEGSDDFGPSLSPDGKWLAFYSDANGYLELHVARADGTERQSLGAPLRVDDNRYAYDDGNAWNFTTTWSPDSARIAFVSFHDGDGEIYVIGRDGTGLRRLTDRPGLDAMPSWGRMPAGR